MRKAPQRLACPACLGVALEAATATSGAKLHHCRRCGGTWLLRGQIARLRTVPAKALRLMLPRADGADGAGFACHDCHAPMDRDAATCACGWKNTLECPDCGRPMRRQTERGVTVDVCRGCEAVWLDNHELSALWAGAATAAVAQASAGSSLANAGADAGSFLLDALFYAPDLTVGAVRGAAYVAGEGIELAANVASSAPGLLSSLPEALGGFFEVAGDVAGSVFGVIVEIIGGIFEGIG